MKLLAASDIRVYIECLYVMHVYNDAFERGDQLPH